jgi:hypothetical protein
MGPDDPLQGSLEGCSREFRQAVLAFRDACVSGIVERPFLFGFWMIGGATVAYVVLTYLGIPASH